MNPFDFPSKKELKKLKINTIVSNEGTNDRKKERRKKEAKEDNEQARKKGTRTHQPSLAPMLTMMEGPLNS